MSSSPVVVPDSIQNIYIPGPPKSRFASHYYEKTGDLKTATRFDRCGSYRDIRDKNGHTKREHRHCMSAWCRYCAVQLNRATFERWEETLMMMSFEEFEITFVEASIPQPERTREAINDALEAIEDKFYDALLKENLGINPHWQASPGYKGLNVVCRVLMFQSPYSQEMWASMFPANATVTIRNYPADHIRRIFKEKLLAIEIEDNPEDRAEQAILLKGVRRFRAHGVHIGLSSPEDDLFAESQPPANISPEQLQSLEDTLIPARLAPHHICSICGEEFDEETQWFNPDAPNPRPSEKRWYARHPHSPPDH